MKNFNTLFLFGFLILFSCQGEGPSTLASSGVATGEDSAHDLALVYSLGSGQLFHRTNALLLEGEIERRKNAGLPTSAEISNEMVEVRIQKALAENEKANPGKDFWDQVAAAGYTEAAYREEVRRTLLLDAMFFPDDPDAWPLEILEEVFEAGAENSLWDTWVVKMPDQIREAQEKGEWQGMDDNMLQMFLRPSVLRWLRKEADIREVFAGDLPEGVCLSVNGKEVSTSEMLASLEPVTTMVDRERVAKWVEIVAKVKAALLEQGVLMSAEEVMAAIAEDKKEYVQSPISYEQVALQFLGFPSMEYFHQHYQLRKSFRKTLPDPFPLETLEAHLAARRQFLGDGQVDVDVILIAARDMGTGRFPKDGDSFAEAKNLADEVAGKLADEEGANWDSVLEQYSDFPKERGNALQGAPQPNKGKFGKQRRNPLREFLGGNDYMTFLAGRSLGDTIFFDAELGAIYGPVRGPHGWYIYRVNHRVEPSREIDIANDERQHFIVSDDFLTVRFLEFVEQVLERDEG
ncbi:MAG TPA: hypothetical protein DDW23_05710 [Planctomycetes bacterium]|mgnify:CR=1 FL=1|nr:hypothetical protein [Planctomycetota bacterium]